jgi:hypothetical protein
VRHAGSEVLRRRFRSHRSPWTRDVANVDLRLTPTQPPEERIRAVATAITESEFEQSGPPRDRPIANLTRLLDALAHGREVEVSGTSAQYPEHFLGGVLDPRTLRFRVPHLDSDDQALLLADLARFEALKQALRA